MSITKLFKYYKWVVVCIKNVWMHLCYFVDVSSFEVFLFEVPIVSYPTYGTKFLFGLAIGY